MQLWQLDVPASACLVDGGESRVATGIDDHSRFCVLAQVALGGTARAACLAFIGALRTYGAPEDVLDSVLSGGWRSSGSPHAAARASPEPETGRRLAPRRRRR